MCVYIYYITDFVLSSKREKEFSFVLQSCSNYFIEVSAVPGFEKERKIGSLHTKGKSTNKVARSTDDLEAVRLKIRYSFFLFLLFGFLLCRGSLRSTEIPQRVFRVCYEDEYSVTDPELVYQNGCTFPSTLYIRNKVGRL